MTIGAGGVRTTRTPDQPCPGCGTILSVASDVLHGQAPSPGDVMVCAHCGILLRYGPDLLRRVMSPFEEWEVRRSCPEIAAIERAMAALKSEGKGPPR